MERDGQEDNGEGCRSGSLLHFVSSSAPSFRQEQPVVMPRDNFDNLNHTADNEAEDEIEMIEAIAIFRLIAVQITIIMKTASRPNKKSAGAALAAYPQSDTTSSANPGDRVEEAGFASIKNTQKHKSGRDARLEARITQATHSKIKLAAELQGRTVTDFVVHAALEAATREIKENLILQLTVEGQQTFAEALLHPPEPNDALRRAFQRHEELTVKNS